MHYMKEKKGYTVFRYLIYIGLFVFLVFPLYWIISTSLRTEKEIMSTSGSEKQSDRHICNFDHQSPGGASDGIRVCQKKIQR